MAKHLSQLEIAVSEHSVCFQWKPNWNHERQTGWLVLQPQPLFTQSSSVILSEKSRWWKQNLVHVNTWKLKGVTYRVSLKTTEFLQRLDRDVYFSPYSILMLRAMKVIMKKSPQPKSLLWQKWVFEDCKEVTWQTFRSCFCYPYQISFKFVSN